MQSTIGVSERESQLNVQIMDKEKAINEEHCDESRQPIRVWVDGCFDVFHYGHSNALRQARQMGNYLIAGVHSDRLILENKQTPIYREEHRYKLISAVKWVDQVFEDSPYRPTVALLQEHNCDFLAHGDDISINAQGEFSYQELLDAGVYREFKRMEGISTTDIIDRILIGSTAHHVADDEPWTNQTKLLALAQGKTPSCSKTGVSFYNRTTAQIETIVKCRKRPKAKVVYVCGAFDLFHVGQLEFIEKASNKGVDHLVVGIYTDKMVNEDKGSCLPIMNLRERVLTLISIKYVSEVLVGAPKTVDQHVMQHYNVSTVLHGNTPITRNRDKSDPYAVPKLLGQFHVIDSGCLVRSVDSVNHIITNRDLYEQRKDKQMDMAKQFETQKLKEQLIPTVNVSVKEIPRQN